jgi:murein DD-endopeptidase MepM/ murein hydrolase activator NlpD
MKKAGALLGVAVIALLAWVAAGSNDVPVSPAMGAPAPIVLHPPIVVPPPTPSLIDPESPRPLIIPVAGAGQESIRDMFNEVRGNRRHEAIDIMAPRGTPVIAADDGVVRKLFTSVPGGLTVYEFDPDQRFCYYYAHLDRYADGLKDGQAISQGDVIGYVGTTGNAPANTPHLHFAVFELSADKRWWQGKAVDPYEVFKSRG